MLDKNGCVAFPWDTISRIGCLVLKIFYLPKWCSSIMDPVSFNAINTPPSSCVVIVVVAFFAAEEFGFE